MEELEPPFVSASIIYQNAERDITLIDIPTSIAAAQARSDTLLSTLPLEAPIHPKHYRPKTHKEKAKAKTKANDALGSAQHAEYGALLQEALAQIRLNVSGSWCAHRTEHVDTDHLEQELDFRLRQWAAWREGKGEDTVSDLHKMMASLGATSEYDAIAAADAATHKWVVSYRAARESANSREVATKTDSREAEPKEQWTSTFHNPENLSLELTISQNTSQLAELGQKYRFTIPPRSTLLLSDSTLSDAFRASFRKVTNEYTLPRHFDLVLLDPPWPNRSAKRKGAYEQIGGMPYMKRMLLKMDIDSYLEHNALVAVWITNKQSLRDHVLGSNGLFEKWNVGLIEEWIWIKTTTKGEAMFDLDGDDDASSMRKPYEILLLGRAAPNSWTTMAHALSIKRRVIAAVPDIHSRKPCLKELLEPYMPDPTDYSALELFSRYLVSGWTSWGNEVLKYNWDKFWVASSCAFNSPPLPPEQRLAFRTI